MRIDLNAKVRTRDGHDAGEIRRVIVDPDSGRITGLVIRTGRLLGRAVIVAEDALAAAEPSGDTITLSLTKEELDALPTFAETVYVLPPAEWVAPASYSLPASAYLWPVPPAAPATTGRPSRPRTSGSTRAPGAREPHRETGRRAGALNVDREEILPKEREARAR
ncbi:MAG TPA: PRC-barrel domain-containing protein [Candidatus Limnocylindria bacterium]|nr:PRC-barrel domain-containing protein [Candidatus Limnocylindria bacterium]